MEARLRLAALFSLAVGIAWKGTRSQRVRQFIAGTVSCLTMVALLATAGGLFALAREEGRIDKRAAIVSTSETPTQMKMGRDSYAGHGYPIVWLRFSAEATATTPTPPGIPAGAGPGWYLSPGLMRLRTANPELVKRFPGPTVIGKPGVLNQAELFAYRIVPPDQSLGEGAEHIRAFGSNAHGLILDSDDRTEYAIPQMAMATLGMVIAPVLLALLTVVSAASGLRRRRLAVLDAIGVPPAERAMLVAMETLALALPGTLLAAAAWTFMAPQLTTVPLVGRAVDGADLQHPLLTACILVLQVVLVVVLAVAHSNIGRQYGPRPARPVRQVTRWRILPVAAGLTLIALSFFKDGRQAASMVLSGITALAFAIPFAYPVMVQAWGNRMRRSTHSAVVLAGGRLTADPLGAIRHLLGIAVILLVTPTALVWLATANRIDAPPVERGGYATFVITGVDGSHFDQAASALQGVLVRPVQQPETDPSQGEPAAVYKADCPSVARLLGSQACANGRFAPGTATRLRQIMSMPFPINLVPDGRTGGSPESFMIVPRSPGVEDELRTRLLNAGPRVSVASGHDLAIKRSPLVDWIFGGLTVMTVLMAVALVGGLADRVSVAMPYVRLLTALGMTPRSIRALQVREQLSALGVVCGGSLILGLLLSLAWSRVDTGVPYPAGQVALLALSATAITAMTVVIATMAGLAGENDPRARRRPL